MAIFILLFGGILDKSFVSTYVEQLTEQIQTVNEELVESIGKEAISKTIEILPTTTIFDLAIDYFLKSLPYGVFLTIIISLILRKKTF